MNPCLHDPTGNYGGGVQSYFLFLRFLVLLNFFSFLLIAGFVIIPSIVFRSVGTSLFNSTGNDISKLHFGFMEYSYMFYGYYNNTMVADMNFSYNIPLAYLLTAAFYFAFCLISIIIRSVKSLSGGDPSYIAKSWAVRRKRCMIDMWQFFLSILTPHLISPLSLSFGQVDLEEESRKKQAAALSLSQKVVLYSLRIFMGLVAFGLIIGAFYGIFEATNFSQVSLSRCCLFQSLYLPSIVITIGNFVVPLLCDQIALVERYSPSTTIIVALLRAVFLRLVSLGALLFTLWGQITCEGDTESPPCKLCQYNEMYKLTLFDLLISITLLIFVEFPRRMVVDNWSCKLAQWLGRQEFVVPSNVLGLVYGQTVVWMGALFCPLLPLINTIKFVILFYCKKVTLFHNCRPAVRTFRSTTSTIYFLVVLLFGWGLATVVMIYSLAEIRPSMGCGPFRFFPNMWSVVPTSFYSLSKTTQEFLFFIGSQAFSIPLFVLSCVVMCYFIALASVYGRNVALLKAQLKLVSCLH
uniref:Transmembrane channel-like protein n=1 Tax=Echeneis naucrates TaxID=173247 RepID=A0A665VTI0_ECHNA